MGIYLRPETGTIFSSGVAGCEKHVQLKISLQISSTNVCFFTHINIYCNCILQMYVHNFYERIHVLYMHTSLLRMFMSAPDMSGFRIGKG